MKKAFLLCLLLPLAVGATTRTITISAPDSVHAGQSLVVPTSASTDATNGEQIGFYHAEYSTDGGVNWVGFCYDVDVGAAATRNAWITAGPAGSTILVRVRVAFRGAGDFDYAGNWIDWGGTWGDWQSPPTRYATIAVQAVPNEPPQVEWVGSRTTASINEWFTVQARASDANGNLAYLHVWRDGVPFAFSGGGNGGEVYSDANLTALGQVGTIQFRAQAGDGGGLASPAIERVVSIANRDPSVGVEVLDANRQVIALDSSGRARVAVYRDFFIRVNAHDPDGRLAALYPRIADLSGGVAAEEKLVSGSSASWTFGPYNSGSILGVRDVWAHARDADSGAYQEQGNGWALVRGPNVQVVAAPPTPPTNLSISTNKSAYVFGEPIVVTARSTDPNSDLRAHHYVVAWSGAYSSNHWEGFSPAGVRWRHFTSASASGSDSTSQVTLVDSNYGLGRSLAPGSYSVTLNSQDSVPNYTYDPAWVMAAFTISKAPPVITGWQNQSRVGAGPLVSHATLASSYGGAVAAPTGSLSYALVSASGSGASPTSGAVISGSTIFQPGEYVVRATHAGDQNYSSGSWEMTFSVTEDPNADSDGDGMSNGWEMEYFLGTTAAVAGADADGDGLTNVAEFNLNTLPNRYDRGTSALGNAIPAGWPNANAKPNEPVGATAGTLQVDKNGAATYSVPLWVGLPRYFGHGVGDD